MSEHSSPRPSQSSGRNKRVVVLSVILVCVFVAWVVTMVVSSGQP